MPARCKRLSCKRRVIRNPFAPSPEDPRRILMASSPAFVWEPEGNGCAERFIRTLKENLLWLKTFDPEYGARDSAPGKTD